MGIKIIYEVPAAAGTAFTYSVQRHEDGAFFDFEQKTFRPLECIAPHAARRLLRRGVRGLFANFKHSEVGKKYIILVVEASPHGSIIAEVPVTDYGKGQHMDPSYRKGKKFVDGKAIDAKYRLVVFGDDGSTVYTATLWEDGTTSCNCPRWGPKQPGLGRRCIHSVRAAKLTANVDETGEQPGPPPPTPGNNPFRRRSRSIDT